ncbi:MAG: hypothetical protein J7M34_10030, partial [Anaerolineae bacterium]|nr:hypothetical protein [Anaerolineae bacterium]
PSQIAHPRGLLKPLGSSEEDLVLELHNPLDDLTKREAATLLTRFQEEAKKQDEQRPRAKRRRPYLPESVDEFELKYLTAHQEAGDELIFHLFDGSEVRGRVIGFGPYTITVGHEDDSETTLNKLAIAYYRATGRQV